MGQDLASGPVGGHSPVVNPLSRSRPGPRQPQSCPAGGPDFRAQQCAEFDGQDFQGRRYKWLPYYGGKPAPLPTLLRFPVLFPVFWDLFYTLIFHFTILTTVLCQIHSKKSPVTPARAHRSTAVAVILRFHSFFPSIYIFKQPWLRLCHFEPCFRGLLREVFLVVHRGIVAGLVPDFGQLARGTWRGLHSKTPFTEGPLGQEVMLMVTLTRV